MNKNMDSFDKTQTYANTDDNTTDRVAGRDRESKQFLSSRDRAYVNSPTRSSFIDF